MEGDCILETFKKFFNGIKNKVKPVSLVELLYWGMIIGALLIKSFYFQITSKLNVRPFFSVMNRYMLLSSFGVLLIIASIIIIAFNKKRRIVLLIVDIILSLLLFADTIYYRYYNAAISVSVLYQMGLVGSVGDSITNLFKVKDIIYFIDFPFLIATLLFMRKLWGKTVAHFHIYKRLATAVVIFIIGFSCIKITYNNVDTSTFPYDDNYVSRYMGVSYFHGYDIKRFVKQNLLTDRSLTAEERQQIENFFNERNEMKNGSNNPKYRGVAKGKNLIIVQVEALQHFVINRKLEDGREITPNLNKLINESAYFDNFYYQIGGGNTSDAEFLVNTSLYPIKEGSVYFRFPSNTYYSIGNILKEEGYDTYVFHANNPTFWNRNVMYKSIGFDDFMSNKRYVLDEYVGWGLGDKSFYRQSLDRIDTSKPFYGFMISLSSHFPYKYQYFEDYDFDTGRFEGSLMGYYIKSAHYADEALGEFIERLKKEGLYDNSLLVVYGDHMAIPRDKADDLMDFLGMGFNEFDWAKLQKVPCFIRYPGVENGKVFDITAGQIDLLPTIMNLMGIDTPYALGKDLFNTDSGYAVLRNSSVITDNYMYLSNTRKVYDINTGEILDESIYDNEIKSLQQELFISDIIIQKNAFAKID